jgi:hypothetical protein
VPGAPGIVEREDCEGCCGGTVAPGAVSVGDEGVLGTVELFGEGTVPGVVVPGTPGVVEAGGDVVDEDVDGVAFGAEDVAGGAVAVRTDELLFCAGDRVVAPAVVGWLEGGALVEG